MYAILHEDETPAAILTSLGWVRCESIVAVQVDKGRVVVRATLHGPSAAVEGWDHNVVDTKSASNEVAELIFRGDASGALIGLFGSDGGVIGW